MKRLMLMVLLLCVGCGKGPSPAYLEAEQKVIQTNVAWYERWVRNVNEIKPLEQKVDQLAKQLLDIDAKLAAKGASVAEIRKLVDEWKRLAAKDALDPAIEPIQKKLESAKALREQATEELDRQQNEVLEVLSATRDRLQPPLDELDKKVVDAEKWAHHLIASGQAGTETPTTLHFKSASAIQKHMADIGIPMITPKTVAEGAVPYSGVPTQF